MEVPIIIRKEAEKGLMMKKAGYHGGTKTGWNRAKQLIEGSIDVKTLRVMRNWFARHRITSYPGYKLWQKEGHPLILIDKKKNSYRGAVAWLIWGGSPAYEWIRSSQVQNILNKYYPDKISTLPSL